MDGFVARGGRSLRSRGNRLLLALVPDEVEWEACGSKDDFKPWPLR
jgi:hypothetical protein